MFVGSSAFLAKWVFTRHPPSWLLRLRRYHLSTDDNLNSLGEVRVRSQEFAFWGLEESLNNEN